jgi:hypothetical protein
LTSTHEQKEQKKMTDVTKYKPNKPSNLTSNKPRQDANIDAFVQRSRALQAITRSQAQRCRLVFALDATASRQPTWDIAMQLQGEMFEEVSNLDVQLASIAALVNAKPRPGSQAANGWPI